VVRLCVAHPGLAAVVDEEEAVGFTHDDRFALNQLATGYAPGQSAFGAAFTVRDHVYGKGGVLPASRSTQLSSRSHCFSTVPMARPWSFRFSWTVVAITPLSDETPAPHAPRSRDANTRCNDGRSRSSGDADGTFGYFVILQCELRKRTLCIDNHLMTLGSIAVPLSLRQL
jgi:hypothetical protein